MYRLRCPDLAGFKQRWLTDLGVFYALAVPRPSLGEIWIRLNGSDNHRFGAQDYVGPADIQTLTVVVMLTVGDYVECCIYLETSSGGETSKDKYRSGDDLNRVKFERVL
jgi:hypothetical protein